MTTPREQACFLLGLLVGLGLMWLRYILDRRHARMLREIDVLIAAVETDRKEMESSRKVLWQRMLDARRAVKGPRR